MNQPEQHTPHEQHQDVAIDNKTLEAILNNPAFQQAILHIVKPDFVLDVHDRRVSNSEVQSDTATYEQTYATDNVEYYNREQKGREEVGLFDFLPEQLTAKEEADQAATDKRTLIDIAKDIEDIKSDKYQVKRTFITKKGNVSKQKRYKEVVDETVLRDRMDELADRLVLSGYNDDEILDLIQNPQKIGLSLTNDEKEQLFEQVATSQELVFDSVADIMDANDILQNTLEEFLMQDGNTVKSFFRDKDNRPTQEFLNYDNQITKILMTIDSPYIRNKLITAVNTQLVSIANEAKIATDENKPPSSSDGTNGKPAGNLPPPLAKPGNSKKPPTKPNPIQGTQPASNSDKGFAPPKPGDKRYDVDNRNTLDAEAKKQFQELSKNYKDRLLEIVSADTTHNNNNLDKINILLSMARREAKAFFKDHENEGVDFRHTPEAVGFSLALQEVVKDEYKNTDAAVIKKKIDRELERLKLKIDTAEQSVKKPSGIRRLINRFSK